MEELHLWQRILEKLIEFDKKCNKFFGPALNFIFRPEIKFGNSDQTISLVFELNKHNCKLCGIMCKVLHIFDEDHCKKSHESYLERRKEK